MRVLFALAIVASGMTAASAADFDGGRGYQAIGVRSEQLIIYDYQPGVVVRAYWRAPWRHRHYYPSTGKKPRVGRREHLSVTGSITKPAGTFERYWSTSSLFLPVRLRGPHIPDVTPEPREEQFSPPPLRGK